MREPIKLSFLNLVAANCLLALFGSSSGLSQESKQESPPNETQEQHQKKSGSLGREAEQPQWQPLAPVTFPLIHSTDFGADLAHWELSDDGWRLDKDDHRQFLSQFRKQSSFVPAVRSPFHRAILASHEVTDFQLDVKVRSTHPPYGHRDVCLFFGYQSPTQFYYVHLGELMDPHCNQIFIVDNQARVSISRTTSRGTPWDDQWHHVRIVRKTGTGQIAVYFDDLDKPVMTAVDQTFLFGRVGLGSFDDTADWAEFRLRGLKSEKPESNKALKTETENKPDHKEAHQEAGNLTLAAGVSLE